MDSLIWLRSSKFHCVYNCNGCQFKINGCVFFWFLESLKITLLHYYITWSLLEKKKGPTVNTESFLLILPNYTGQRQRYRRVEISQTSIIYFSSLLCFDIEMISICNFVTSAPEMFLSKLFHILLCEWRKWSYSDLHSMNLTWFSWWTLMKCRFVFFSPCSLNVFQILMFHLLIFLN